MLTDVNFLAVLVSAVVLMAIGFVWYSPMVFGNALIKAMGLSKRDMESESCKRDAKRGYLSSFIGGIVTAYVLALMIENLLIDDWNSAVLVGFLLWLGLVFAPSFSCLFFEKKPVTLYLINSGFTLLSVEVMIIILTLWR